MHTLSSRLGVVPGCRTALLIAALGLPLAACDDGKSAQTGSDATAVADAAVGDAARADALAADAGTGDASLKLRCTCSGQPENCEGCLALISQCCTGEATFGGRLPYLVATCKGDPNCEACCDECATRTCAQVIAAGDCPVVPDSMPESMP